MAERHEKSISQKHPRYAPSLVGHGKIVDALKTAYAHNRFPHGLLLTGPKGIGKATLAHQISRALLTETMDHLSESITALTPTDHLLRAGNHPDFIMVERSIDDKGKLSKDISVESARAVLNFYSQTSIEDNWRIAIIDSIEDLTTKGANSLLKILEEPPAKCLLILIAHNLEGVLPTLRSRSQILPLVPLSPEETRLVLQHSTPENAPFLSTVCAGRPGLGNVISDLGGESFYKSFLALIKDLSIQDLRSIHPFIDTSILKNPTLSPDQGWMHFATFLTHWIPHALSQSLKGLSSWGAPQEPALAKTFFETKRSDKWSDTWFYIQDLLQTTHVYSLDRKQTLSCVFYELAGLYKK